MRVGRERRSARQRRAHANGRRRPMVLVAVVSSFRWSSSGSWPASSCSTAHGGRGPGSVPSLEAQHSVTLAQTTQIFADDGTTLLAYLHGTENRTVISGKDIPTLMRLAVVSVEDERFYSHSGWTYEALSAPWSPTFQARGVSEGFSTITMQLVGNLYLDRSDVSLTRKFDEVALAWQMERKYSKNEILDMYLNTVYFGSNAYGIEAAARTYFDKDPVDLTLPEAALLAGLPQSPQRVLAPAPPR